jgi:hypothetical protein
MFPVPLFTAIAPACLMGIANDVPHFEIRTSFFAHSNTLIRHLSPIFFHAGGKYAALLHSLIIIDKVSLFCGERIRRRALFVKAILSQHVVSRYGAI